MLYLDYASSGSIISSNFFFLDIKGPWCAYKQDTLWQGLGAEQRPIHSADMTECIPTLPAGGNREGFAEESTSKPQIVHSFDKVAEKQVEMDPQTFSLPRICLCLFSQLCL